MGLPYLYPQFHFMFKKNFDFFEHVFFCAFIYIIGSLAINAGKKTGNSVNHRLFSNLSKPTVFLYKVSKTMIYISCIANCLIAFFVYFGSGLSTSADLDLIQAKNQKHSFSGFTFLSQLYLFFIPYFISFSILSKKPWKPYIFIIIICVLLRAYFYTERLALIELFVFLLVTLEYLMVIKITYKKILISALIFLLFFIGGELTRQFYSQYVLESYNKKIDWNFALSWSLERYAAYYADTTNKVYLVIENELFFLTQYYFGPFEQVLSKFIKIEQNNRFNLQNYGLLKQSIYQDFTNVNGLATLLLDFGYLGLIGYFILFYFFGLMYSIYIKGKDLVVLSIYPAFVIMGLEFGRIMYFYDTRILIPFLIFLLVLILNLIKNKGYTK